MSAEPSLGAAARLYWRVAALGFRKHTAYWGATWAGLFTNTVFGFLRAYVFLAVYRQLEVVGGLDVTDALTYTFLTQSMIMLINMWTLGDIPLRVRSGEIATDLYRPIDFQAYSLAEDYGRALYQALFRGVPPFVVGAVVFHLRVPAKPSTWLLFLASCALAVAASFGMRFLLALTSFWLLDWRGISRLHLAATMFLSGFVIPVAFFPEPFRSVARVLPYTAFVELPIRVFLGKEGLAALAVQAVWAVVLIAFGRVVLAAATRKLVVQGG